MCDSVQAKTLDIPRWCTELLQIWPPNEQTVLERDFGVSEVYLSPGLLILVMLKFRSFNWNVAFLEI